MCSYKENLEKFTCWIFHVCVCVSDSACKDLRTADGFHEICYGVVLLKFVDSFTFGKN